MAIAWNKSFEIGHLEIDEQHKQLIERYNEFMAACASGKGKLEVEYAINYLIDYAVRHFAAEEDLQIKIDYPGFDRHKQMHDAFKLTATKLAGQLKDEGSSARLIVKFNAEIGDWIDRHIKTEDKKIAEYISRNN